MTITREWLERRRSTVLADLKLKVEAEDWHGVADAAMDLREIEAQLVLVKQPLQAEQHRWADRFDPEMVRARS